MLSRELKVPESIKTTSVKPSGTVSLLAGATPGVHYPHSPFYTRRVRVPKTSELLQGLETANYFIEEDQMDKSSLVVEIPVALDRNVRALSSVSLEEQLELAAFMQKHWADNQVSCTITFDPETEGPRIEAMLDRFQHELKGISFLPRSDGVYPQMPYEEISEKTYVEQSAKLGKLDFSYIRAGSDVEGDKFCDNSNCQV